MINNREKQNTLLCVLGADQRHERGTEKSAQRTEKFNERMTGMQKTNGEERAAGEEKNMY